MNTRLEINERLKKKIFLKKVTKWILSCSVVACLLVYSYHSLNDYFGSPNYNVKIAFSNFKCNGKECTYRVVLRNISNESFKSSLKVRGKVELSSTGLTSSASHEFYNEKLPFSLGAKKEVTLTGVVPSEDADTYFIFRVM